MLIRAGFAGAALAACALFAYAESFPLDHPAIGYLSTPHTDPVSQLIRQIETGKTQLSFDPKFGYLPGILKLLDIPVESQMAVFSKTSVQAQHIEPDNPRVLYFNDSVIVGWVHGGFLEIAAQDPRVGMVFYTADQREIVYREQMARAPHASPFNRRQDCLRCHRVAATFRVPGVLFRSVFPGPSGIASDRAPQYDTDNRMPFDKLWGGWYVTGNSGSAPHMGNLIAPDDAHPMAMLRDTPLHVDSLEGKCPAATRLTPYSDVAALLVFEHQVRMMNLMVRAAWESRVSLADTHSLNTRARAAVDDLADFMLFTDEAPLKGEISSTSGFSEVFSARGPRDHQGRGLHELSLKGRLLRYPCSYMIYTPAFDALPGESKDAVYRRMWEILATRPPADRQAIVEILRDTKPGLPDYFRVTLH